MFLACFAYCMPKGLICGLILSLLGVALTILSYWIYRLLLYSTLVNYGCLKCALEMNLILI